MRRTWLHGQETVEKRYLIHVAGFNLGVLMRSKYGVGTPREAAHWTLGCLIFQFGKTFLAIFVAISEQDEKMHALAVATIRF